MEKAWVFPTNKFNDISPLFNVKKFCVLVGNVIIAAKDLFKITEIILKAIRYSGDGLNKGSIIWLRFLEIWFTLINYFIYFILNNI